MLWRTRPSVKDFGLLVGTLGIVYASARAARPPPADILKACQVQLGVSGDRNAPSVVSGPDLDGHLYSARLEERYEDPALQDASRIAAHPKAVRCSHMLLQGRDYCPQLSFSTPTRGHIFQQFESGHYSYEPDACVLRRLTGREATACLAEEVGPVLFMGDSVTRYQFLTFIHFLASGKYQHPTVGSNSLSDSHQHTLTHGSNKYDKLWEHAREQVEEHTDRGFLRYDHNRSLGLERAHFQMKVKGSTLDVYFIYVSRGFPMFRDALEWALSKRSDWSQVILNVCAHYGPNQLENQLADDVIRFFKWAARRLADYSASVQQHRRPTRLVWKSCTTMLEAVRKTVDEAEEEIGQYCRRAGVEVYDLRGVSASAAGQHLVTTWTAETVHFWQFMYENFNDLLLNVLCSG